MKERIIFLRNGTGKLDIQCVKGRDTLHQKQKNQFKWIEDINLRSKTIKLLEENIGEHLYDARFDSGFLSVTPQHRQ